MKACTCMHLTGHDGELEQRLAYWVEDDSEEEV